MLSGETRRCALIQDQSKGIKILNISFPRLEIEPTTRSVYSHTVVLLIYYHSSLNKYTFKMRFSKSNLGKAVPLNRILILYNSKCNKAGLRIL